jgi:hypothetical protein
MEKKIYYFDGPGPENTTLVIKGVRERIKELGIKYVVVASDTGTTAIKVAEALKDLKVKVICVTSYPGIRIAYPKGPWVVIADDVKSRLKELEVKILEETPWIFKGVTFDAVFLGRAAPSWAIHEFISRVMGYGFKVALEITLLAAEAGVIPPDEEVITISGTGWLGGGADYALVIKPSVVQKMSDLKEGLEVREIIAMPRIKFNKELIAKLGAAGETRP